MNRRKLLITMFKSSIIGVIANFILFTNTNLASTLAATYDLKAFPLSGSEVKLEWLSSENNYYDIWQTTNGREWYKIATTTELGQYRETEVHNYDSSTGSESWTTKTLYAYTYIVNEGINPYKNYYFATTVKDSVLSYPNGADVSNASNEAVAFPPHQMGHGYFSSTSDLCGNCHSVHTGISPKLLSFSTVNDSCISCHDGTGSKYSVTNGTVDKDGTYELPLKGLAGPFGAILNRSSTSFPISVHNLDQPINSAPGGNPNNLSEPLNCGSCHTPHSSYNYRSLKILLPENPNVRVKGYAETGLTDGKEKPYYAFGMSSFCKGCHIDYMAPKGSGSIPATETHQTDGKYRHPVGVSISTFYKGPLSTTLPLEGPIPTNNYISCITCHFSHGSESKTNNISNYLLKMDYRGICEDCHKK